MIKHGQYLVLSNGYSELIVSSPRLRSWLWRKEQDSQRDKVFGKLSKDGAEKLQEAAQLLQELALFHQDWQEMPQEVMDAYYLLEKFT